MSIAEREIWACAAQLLRQYGDRAPQHISERIVELSKKGDELGVALWLAIADKLDQLTPQNPQLH